MEKEVTKAKILIVEDKECFDIIQFQVKSINKLVNDILYLSEIEFEKNRSRALGGTVFGLAIVKILLSFIMVLSRLKVKLAKELVL